jgi:hypothetical protein
VLVIYEVREFWPIRIIEREEGPLELSPWGIESSANSLLYGQQWEMCKWTGMRDKLYS